MMGRGPSSGDGMGLGTQSSAVMSASSAVRSSDSILVRNLPPECGWQSLREGFSHCGDIKYAEMKDRGVGIIRFSSEREAERAISEYSVHWVDAV